MIVKTNTFGELFKKYRLKAGIYTLAQFGHLLAEEGFVYEDSIFSHWQKGDRLPKQRELLIAIIKLFVKKNALVTYDEANQILASLRQRDLSEDEKKYSFSEILGKYQYNVPNEPAVFVGRKSVFKEIAWRLLNKKSILLYGGAGIGKTMLAIKTSSFLKDEFPDGIFWFRFDIKSINEILNHLGKAFDYDLNSVKTTDEKIKILCPLLARKRTLIIFDNVDNYKKSSILTALATATRILITTKFLPSTKISKTDVIKIQKFNEKEAFFLAKKILGNPYVVQNEEKIEKLSSMVGFLPLGLTIVFRQLEKNPNRINHYLKSLDLRKDILFKKAVGYDNQTLEKSIHFSASELENKLKKIFLSLGVFRGTDFSQEEVAYLNKQKKDETGQQLKTLLRFSLIEKSIKKRFRLHPLVRTYIQTKNISAEQYKRLADFYLMVLGRCERGSLMEAYPKIEQDLENILGVFIDCFHVRFYNCVIDLWEHLGIFLWETGRWFDVVKYGKIVVQSAQKLDNKKALASCLIRELSWLYFWQGDIKKAVKLVGKGMRLARKIKDDFLIALAKQKQGMILVHYQKNLPAKDLFLEAIKTFKKLKMTDRIADTYLYLGHVYKNLNFLDKAKHYYQRSNKGAIKLKDYEAEGISLYYLGEIYFFKKDFDQAKKCFNRAMVIDGLRGRKAGIGWCSMGLAKIEKEQGRRKKAIQLFEDAKEVFEKIGLKPQLQVVLKELKSLNSHSL